MEYCSVAGQTLTLQHMRSSALASVFVALSALCVVSASSLHLSEHNESLTAPAAEKRPHIVMVLFDDFGWADAGWHRNYTAPGGEFVPATPEVLTPNMNQLVRSGIELDRNYVYKYCSPTRSALQTGRNPVHVNNVNAAPTISNPEDPVSGFAGVPRNMTGIATKLAAAGYHTAMFGKWDAGMATPDHTPFGRGYIRSMNYFHHDNDYWSMSVGSCDYPIVDLWHKYPGSSEGPARGFNNSGVTGSTPNGGHPSQCQPGPDGDRWFDGYEDALFEREMLSTIHDHNASVPLFLFWAPHIVHTPLQVPQRFIEKFSFMKSSDKPTHNRMFYAAMVNFADEMVGNVTKALKTKGMYEDSLIVFSTDNGGPIYGNGSAGANNFPLRGGKMNNWEGGIRGNGFVSGGFVPEARRGTRYEGLNTAWDWYATFSAFAGVDPVDQRAKHANLPPIDSHDLSPVILGSNLTSPRTIIPLGTEPRRTNFTNAPLCTSFNAATTYYEDPRVVGDELSPLPKDGHCTSVSGVIVDQRNAAGGNLWKLLTGDVQQDIFTGPHYPNSSTNEVSDHFVRHCAQGCLFQLDDDPLEEVDLAAKMPEKLQELRRVLSSLVSLSFDPNRGAEDPAACATAMGPNGGFWGPFVK